METGPGPPARLSKGTGKETSWNLVGGRGRLDVIYIYIEREREGDRDNIPTNVPYTIA